MESIYILIPIALVFVGVGVWVFFWAVDSGQFDDLEGPAHSILFDDEPASRQSDSPQQADAQQDPTDSHNQRNA